MISSLLTSALYMRIRRKRTSCARKSVIKTLRNMSKDEYNKHVLQIHEWMKDEEEWKNVKFH